MILPEGIQRENNKIYEEVKIPYSEPMPIGFEEKPVYIQDLDEVRFSFFEGDCFDAWYDFECICIGKIIFKSWLIQ